MENWTIYLVNRNTERGWEAGYDFYQGSVQILADDWRICEVEGKREEAVRLGEVLCDFPVVFPIETSYGVYLDKENGQ